MRALILISLLATSPIAAAQNIDVRPVMTTGMEAAKVDALISAGHSALADKDFAAAYDAFNRARIERRDDGDISLALGDSLLGLGLCTDALPHYRAAPPGAQSFAGTVLCNALSGTSNDIEVDLNAALEINLKDTRLWTALGQFYDSQGRSLEAQSTYIQALKAGADHGVVVNNMGMSHLRAGRYARALEKFEQANALAPNADIFDNNRRLTLALQGDYESAISGVSEARAAHICNDAGYIAARAGDKHIARALFTRALKISPVYFPPAQKNLDALDKAA